MYLHNGPADYYYKRIRDNIKIVLIGCKHSFESCFCDTLCGLHLGNQGIHALQGLLV